MKVRPPSPSTVRHVVRLSYRASPAMTIINVVLIALTAGAVALTAVSQRLIVNAAADHAVAGVLVAAVLGVFAHAGNFALRHVQGEVSQDLTVRVARELDLEILHLTASVPTIEHLERPEFLDRVANLRRGTQALATSVWRTAQAASALISLGLSVWLLAAIHPALPAVAIGAVPVLLLTSRGRRHVRLVRDRTAENERHERLLHEMCLSPVSAKELRVAGSGPELSRRADLLWRDTTRQLTRAHRRAVGLEAAGWLLFTVALGTEIALILHLHTTGVASLGDLVLLLTLGAALSGQLQTTLYALSVVAEAGHVNGHYMWLRRYADEQPAERQPAPDRLTTGISLRRLTFRYPGTDHPVLQDFDLDLRAGETVGLVGVNGAGKTTLVKLLTGLYRPDQGEIRIDGRPLADIDPTQWTARCAGAFQDFAQLQFLLRENVGVGDLPRIADRASIGDAIDRAGGTGIISVVPGGLDGQLGTIFQGTDLSYGQWQKLALARGLLRPAPLLLILDEPSSALDPQAEHELFERFAAQAREAARDLGGITVLVSHRFSSIHMADHIVVLDGGRIREQGSHRALLAAGGRYAQLYTAQATAYA